MIDISTELRRWRMRSLTLDSEIKEAIRREERPEDDFGLVARWEEDEDRMEKMGWNEEEYVHASYVDKTSPLTPCETAMHFLISFSVNISSFKYLMNPIQLPFTLKTLVPSGNPVATATKTVGLSAFGFDKLLLLVEGTLFAFLINCSWILRNAYNAWMTSDSAAHVPLHQQQLV